MFCSVGSNLLNDPVIMVEPSSELLMLNQPLADGFGDGGGEVGEFKFFKNGTHIGYDGVIAEPPFL